MHLSLPHMFPMPRLLLFINYTWSYSIKKLHLDHKVYSYVLCDFWNIYLFPKQWAKWSFAWTGVFLWGRNWSFIYKLNKIQFTIFNIFLVSPYKDILSILQINPTRCTILLSIFISLLYMFRATMCPSPGEITVSMRHWYLSLCRGGVWSSGWSETLVFYVSLTVHPCKTL